MKSASVSIRHASANRLNRRGLLSLRTPTTHNFVQTEINIGLCQQMRGKVVKIIEVALFHDHDRMCLIPREQSKLTHLAKKIHSAKAVGWVELRETHHSFFIEPHRWVSQASTHPTRVSSANIRPPKNSEMIFVEIGPALVL